MKEAEVSGIVQLGEEVAGGDLLAALVPVEKSAGDGDRPFTWGTVGEREAVEITGNMGGTGSML